MDSHLGFLPIKTPPKPAKPEPVIRLATTNSSKEAMDMEFKKA